LTPVCVISILTAALLAPAQAQQALTLDEAVGRAMNMHPLLAVASGRLAISAALTTQARLRPNPRMTVQGENLRPYGGDTFQPAREVDFYAFLTQPFELGQKRERRVELAQANVRRAELDRELTARQIGLRVRQAYWGAAGAQRVLDLLLETAANFGEVIRYHETRVREGAMAEADLLKVRIEGERLAIGVNNAELEVTRARIQLFREMGQAEFPAVRLTEPLEPGGEPPAVDMERALAERTEMKLAHHARETAAALARLERANSRPGLDVLFGYKRTAGFNSVLAGAQMVLPFANRNQGNIAAADAQVRLAESELAAAAALVRADVRATDVEVRTRRTQIAEIMRGLVERAGQSARIAQAAYREGGADLLRLLDAERVRIELATLEYRAIAEYRQSLAALEAALGAGP
jgi:outer membrane protein TolC